MQPPRSQKGRREGEGTPNDHDLTLAHLVSSVFLPGPDKVKLAQLLSPYQSQQFILAQPGTDFASVEQVRGEVALVLMQLKNTLLDAVLHH